MKSLPAPPSSTASAAASSAAACSLRQTDTISRLSVVESASSIPSRRIRAAMTAGEASAAPIPRALIIDIISIGPAARFATSMRSSSSTDAGRTPDSSESALRLAAKFAATTLRGSAPALRISSICRSMAPRARSAASTAACAPSSDAGSVASGCDAAFCAETIASKKPSSAFEVALSKLRAWTSSRASWEARNASKRARMSAGTAVSTRSRLARSARSTKLPPPPNIIELMRVNPPSARWRSRASRMRERPGRRSSAISSAQLESSAASASAMRACSRSISRMNLRNSWTVGMPPPMLWPSCASSGSISARKRSRYASCSRSSAVASAVVGCT